MPPYCLRRCAGYAWSMDVLTSNIPEAVLRPQQPPCLSLFQPTHRRHPENQTDRIRFRNLVKALERSMKMKYSAEQARPLLKPFEDLEHDDEFWNHALDGLAVFSAPGVFEVVRFQQQVSELAVMADTFHTKPLRRFLQAADRFQVLALSREKIRLLEGNRAVLDEASLARGVPRTMTEALGNQLSDPHSTVSAYGGLGGENGPMHHGHGGRKDQIDIDEERFFRVIDRAVLEHHSKPSGLPLILAALPEHHGHFRQVSRNPFLVPEGVKIDPNAISVDQLRERCWLVLEPQYKQRISALIDEFGLAKARGLGLDDLQQIASAIVSGRVGTLLIEADRQIPGHVDAATGQVRFGELEHPDLDDLLDDFSDRVHQKGGRAIVLPSEAMPTPTGAAAICRF